MPRKIDNSDEEEDTFEKSNTKRGERGCSPSEQNEIICEVKNMPDRDESYVNIEPHDPPRETNIGVKKVRKPLSQDSLNKLAKAREMATKKRLELKAGKEEKKIEVKEERKVEKKAKKIEEKNPELKVVPKKKKEILAPLEEEEEEEQPKVVKKKPKKKPVVIIEESGSSSDDNVIYIKKRSKKKVVVSPTPPSPKLEPYVEPEPIINQRMPVGIAQQKQYPYNPYSQLLKPRRPRVGF